MDLRQCRRVNVLYVDQLSLLARSASWLPDVGTDHGNGVSFDQDAGSAVGCRTVCDAVGAHTHLPQHAAKRGAQSGSGCSVFGLGVDGPARRSSLLSPACWSGPPPIPCDGPPRATNRMTRPPRRSLPQEAARGFWIRAWGQREPALQGTGRFNSRPWLGALKGGLDIPATHVGYRSLRIETPNRTLTRRVCTRAGQAGMRLSVHIALSS